MRKIKTIKLRYGIVIELYDNGSGTITSTDLKTEHNDPEDELYNAAMDGIESMILAHAISGVDVTAPEYLEGITTAVDSCAQNF
jgi:hypothetical protein